MKRILASSANPSSSTTKSKPPLTIFVIIGITINQTSASFSFHRTQQQPRLGARNIIIPREDKCCSPFAQPLSSTISSDEWSPTKGKRTINVNKPKNKKEDEDEDEDGKIISISTPLSTVTEAVSNKIIPQDIFTEEVLQVISAAFLITANTVGPSMMVLPNIVAGPGLFVSGLMLCGLWGINLLSALLIAEVAINQYEVSSNDNEIPSSFKDFTELNLQNKAAGFFVSFLCIFVNWCFVSFNVMRMGEIIVANVPSYTTMMSDFISRSSLLLSSLYAFVIPLGDSIDSSDVVSSLLSSCTPLNTAASFSAMVWMALVGTQSNQRLSGVASICCLGLFTSFASILLPGLMNIQSNPFIFSDTASTFGGQLGGVDVSTVLLGALPVFISVTVFQNIVPAVVKVLDYDRTKCVQAMIIGTAIPLMMYLSFSYASLGGGIDLNLISGGALVNIFSIVSVVGSTMASVMSLAGEFDCFFKFGVGEEKEDHSTITPNDKIEVEGECQDVASFLAVSLAVLPPLFAGIYFSDGEEFVQAISVAGSYGSPLLFGVLPVLLAYNLRKQKSVSCESVYKGGDRLKGNNSNKDAKAQQNFQQLAPGGVLGLGLLGVTSISFMWERAMMDLSSIGI